MATQQSHRPVYEITRFTVVPVHFVVSRLRAYQMFADMRGPRVAGWVQEHIQVR